MAQIFRKSTNSLVRASLVGGVFGFFGFWGLVYLIYWSSYTTGQGVPREQEVPFSHQHHVSGLGLDCRYCHTSVPGNPDKSWQHGAWPAPGKEQPNSPGQ